MPCVVGRVLLLAQRERFEERNDQRRITVSTKHKPSLTKTLQSIKQSEAAAESVPSSLRIVCDDASSISLQAAEAAEEGKPALRKFSMVAYTGGAMRLGGWPYPVVVDLAGMRVTRKSRPILKDHDRASIVVHTDDIMACRR